MYLSGMSGYGTSDFNKALKGTNVAAVQKGLDFQLKQLAKRKPKDAKGIAADTAQIAAARARLAQLTAPPATPAPAPVDIKPPPAVSSAPKTPPVAMPGLPAEPPSIAPPAAADSTANILPFGPAPSNVIPFGPPALSPITDPAGAASEATPAAPDNSNTLYILGGLGVLAAFFLLKKKR